MVVTCNNQKVATITGYKAAFGGQVKTTAALEEGLDDMTQGLQGLQDLAEDAQDLMGEETPQDMEEEEAVEKDDSEKLKASFWGILAVLAALAGLITALILDKKAFIMPLVAAIIGFISLIFLPGAVKNQIFESAEEVAMIKVSTQFGYWLSLLSFLVAGVLAFLAGRDKPVLTREQISNVIPDKMEDAFDKAKDSVTTAGAGVAGAVGGAYDKVKDSVEKADLDGKFDKFADSAKDKFGDAVGKVKDTVEKADLDGKFDKFTDSAKDKFGDAVEKVKDTVEKADDKIDDLVDKARNKADDAVDKVDDAVKEADAKIDKLAEEAKDKAAEAADEVKDAVDPDKQG